MPDIIPTAPAERAVWLEKRLPQIKQARDFKEARLQALRKAQSGQGEIPTSFIFDAEDEVRAYNEAYNRFQKMLEVARKEALEG